MKDFLKKYFLLAAMAAYVFLAIASLAGGENMIKERKKEYERSVQSATEAETPMLYRIGISAGRIAVFSVPDGDIIRRTDAQVSLLPEADRERLERGITVEGRENLRQTLEDICS